MVASIMVDKMTKSMEVSDETKTTLDVEQGEMTATQNRTARNLKSRHIQFIALGGTIGTGLFLGIGRALTQAGPLSLLIGYSLTGVAVCGMVSCRLLCSVWRWRELTSVRRCNLWAKWQHGCPFLEPYRSSVLVMWTKLWDSRWDGM